MDLEALKGALGQAITALSQVADMLAAGGGAPAPGAAPAAGAPAPHPAAPKADEKPDAKAGADSDMLEGAPQAAPAPNTPNAPAQSMPADVCPACGQPKSMGKNAGCGPMAMSARTGKAATGDMSYGEFPAADGKEDLAGGQQGAVIKASEPAGSDQFRPGKPQGSVPHDEGGSLGLGAPANPGNSREDLVGSGVEGAVIKTSMAKGASQNGDPMAALAGLIGGLTDTISGLSAQLASNDGRLGKKSLAKSASNDAPPAIEGLDENATELPTEVWVDLLKGRRSIGDDSL